MATQQQLPRHVVNVLRAGGIPVSRLSPSIQVKLITLEAKMPQFLDQAGRWATKRAAALAQQLVTQAFETERYYKPGPRGGRLTKLGANTPRYMKYKRDRDMDRRRGHVSGDLQEAIDNMVSVTASGFGIAVNLPAAAAESGAGEYAKYYEESKAPGLGSPRAIPRLVYREWERILKQRVKAKIAKHLNTVKAPQLIPVLLSDRQLAAWIGKVGVKLKVG